MNFNKLTHAEWNKIIEECNHDDSQSEDDGTIYCPDCNSVIGEEC